MARPRGPLGIAVRTLLNRHKGKLTWKKAYPLLKEMTDPETNQPLVGELGTPEAKSVENTFNVTAYGWRRDKGLVGSRNPAAAKKEKATKASPKRRKQDEVLQPKYAGSSVKKQAVAAPVRKNRKVAEPAPINHPAVELVSQHGGIKGCKSRIEQLREQAAALQAESEQIESAVGTVTTLSKQLSKLSHTG